VWSSLEVNMGIFDQLKKKYLQQIMLFRMAKIRRVDVIIIEKIEEITERLLKKRVTRREEMIKAIALIIS
jgi:hypothetical protein